MSLGDIVKKVNKSRFAILGILLEKPRSGYEILQFMKESTTHFWQESDASIYPMLKILEKEEKVVSQREATGKRERTIFHITDDGKKEFLVWMALPPEKENRRSELLLKLFFGGNTTSKEILKQLHLRMQKVQETKETFKHIETNVLSSVPNKYRHKNFWKMALRYGTLHSEAEITWLTECIKILEKK
jgi:DNA-binding PadR family transcriptional regulator